MVDAGASDLDQERVGHAPRFEHRVDGPAQYAEVQVEPADSVQGFELRQGHAVWKPADEFEQRLL